MNSQELERDQRIAPLVRSYCGPRTSEWTNERAKTAAGDFNAWMDCERQMRQLIERWRGADGATERPIALNRERQEHLIAVLIGGARRHSETSLARTALAASTQTPLSEECRRVIAETQTEALSMWNEVTESVVTEPDWVLPFEAEGLLALLPWNTDDHLGDYSTALAEKIRGDVKRWILPQVHAIKLAFLEGRIQSDLMEEMDDEFSEDEGPDWEEKEQADEMRLFFGVNEVAAEIESRDGRVELPEAPAQNVQAVPTATPTAADTIRFDFASRAGRCEAIASYLERWKMDSRPCTEASLARSAIVDPADLSKWKKGLLPLESEKARRIEAVLTKNTPPTPAARRNLDA